MRLVNDEHGAQATRVSFFERAAQLEQQFRLVLPSFDAEQPRDVLIKLRHAQAWVDDVTDEYRAFEPLHHPTQDGGLPRADFARHHDEALAALDPIMQAP